MKNSTKFKQFLADIQTYCNLLSVAANGLKSLSELADEKNLSSISSALDFSLEHLQKEIDIIKKYQGSGKADHSRLIDFVDNSQAYLDIFITCYQASNYCFILHDDKDIQSVAVSISFAVEKLSKSFDKLLLEMRKEKPVSERESRD